MAKGGSKNSTKNRKQVQKFIFNGKEIKPVKLVGLNSTYMAAEDKDGALLLADSGTPLTLAFAVSLAAVQ